MVGRKYLRSMRYYLGLYEKAMPDFSFEEKLETVKACGFDYMEISIDETDKNFRALIPRKRFGKYVRQ